MSSPTDRAKMFCERFGLGVPILMAPMAGACAPSLAIAVASAGGLGGCGALLMQPDAIRDWARTVGETGSAFQINLWIPEPAPRRDAAREAEVRAFLGRFGPPVPPEAGDVTLPDFAAQCDAMIAARPKAVSSIMGLFASAYVDRLKSNGIAWFACATTVAEARAAEAAGADAIVAQGAEAGGHRGSFEADDAERRAVGLLSLVPAVCDAVSVPVVASGGIADARGLAAALVLGASAVQIGTGFLRCPEAAIAPAWADAIGRAAPEDTMLTRAFSGRAGRSLSTRYARAAADGPNPAPYPVQRGLTAPMRTEAAKSGDVERMQVWAGQSASLASTEPAATLVQRLWREGRALLA